MAKLRIAQVAPLYESVPPRYYGGTERVVYNLTEQLVKAGHDVTLFASGDSLTSARLVPTGTTSLRMSATREALAPHLLMFEKVKAMAHEFDVIHFHNEYMHFPLARSLGTPHVTTLHGRLDLPEYRELFYEFRDLPLISISQNQRHPLPYQNWVGTIHHGMPIQELTHHPENNHARKESYLAFLGRISPEKGVEQAIEIARKSGRRLRIAAKIERYDYDYYLRLKPDLESEGIEFVGEIGAAEKQKFLGEACGLIFPITWPEPFGLVMIEALATGTPVIAFRNGSVPEVIEPQKTGFIVDSIEEAVSAVGELANLSREVCRAEFERRFSVERMVRNHVDLYERLIATHPSALKWAPTPTAHLLRNETVWTEALI